MVSVIMPVYNTFSVLRDAVESVLCQSYPDWELIIVDDGSTDGSDIVCEQYAAADSRIHVIHQKNEGISSARNTGLCAAEGDYLQFLDSDDWLYPDALETLMKTVSDTKASMVIFDAQYEWDDHSMHEKSNLLPGLYAPEFILEKLSIPSIPPYAWNKFCLRSLYDGVFFPIGEKWEDVSTVIYPVSRAGTIAVLDRPLYHYRQREDAITKQAICDGSIYKWQFLQYTKRYDFLQSNYPDIATVAKSSLIRTGIAYYTFFLIGNDQEKERKKAVHVLRSLKIGHEIPDVRIRLKWIAFCAFPRLTATLIRLRRNLHKSLKEKSK